MMKRFARRAVAAAAVGSRLWPIVGRGEAVVLRYHRVASPEMGPVPLAVPAAEFEAQLRFLRARCRVVPAREIVEALAEERPLPPRAVAITFDDGYADNCSVAFPLLRRYGLTATVFVTAGWIGTDRLLWWDRLHQYVSMAAEEGEPPAGYGSLPGPVAKALAAASFRAPSGAERLEAALVAALRSLDLSPEGIDLVLEQIAAALGVGEAGSEGFLPMDWGQVRALREGGMDIGSHTVTHARLAAVPAERAYDELVKAKAIIEEHLDEPVDLLAYPAGNANQDVADLVAEAGYEGAFTTQAGPVRPGDNPYRLCRIGVWAGGYRGVLARFAPAVFGLQIGRLARRGV